MVGIRGVLPEAIGRVGHGHQKLRNLEAKNEVIEDGLEARVAQVVAAVVHDQYGIAPVLPVSSGQIDLHRPLLVEGFTAKGDLFEVPDPGFLVGHGPFRRFVADSLVHRVGAERVVGQERIHGITDPRVLAVSNHIEFVFHP